jgi:uncharacterized protein YbaR (Trm112 family)
MRFCSDRGLAMSDDVPAAAYDRRMLESLVCPRTQSTLRFDAERQELISEAAQLAFPIRDGIPIMLISAARALE